MARWIVVLIIALSFGVSVADSQAVPVGFGANTIGGSGGRTISVTTLADSGAGSLRSALAASGPRIITFGVSGIITLNSDLNISKPFLTLDGGSRVTLRGAMIKIKTNDVIVRNLRVKPGDAANQSNPADRDAITVNVGYNILLEHNTFVWGPDIGGVAILNGSHHVTVRDSIIGEGLRYSRHPEGVQAQGGHSLGANVTELDNGIPHHISLYRNLFTTSGHRMPQVQGAEFVEVVNNVIYNWGKKAAHGNPRSLNLIGNMFIPGPITTDFFAWTPDPNSRNPQLYPLSVYEAGNAGDVTMRAGPTSVYTSAPFAGTVPAVSAAVAYEEVLANVGPAQRNTDDNRLIQNVINRTGGYKDGISLQW